MRVRDISKGMRWSVVIALSSATALIYIVSLRGNYLYGLSLGQTPEKRELFAWANVAADIWKGFGLVAVMLLWHGQKRIAVIASLAWCLCLAMGINSAIAIYVMDRSATTDQRESRRAAYAELTRELATVEARIEARGSRRSVEEIDAAVTAVLARPVHAHERIRGTMGSLSHACTKSDTRTAEACAEVAALREERAAADAIARLERDAADLRAEQRKLRVDGSGMAADPVGEFWAWATLGLLSIRDISFGFPLLFALLIETVSAFGPAVIVAIAAGGSLVQQGPAGVRMQPAAATRDKHVGVMEWLAENTEPTGAQSGIRLRELHVDYVAWCARKGSTPCDEEHFGELLDRVRAAPEIARTIRKGANRYYGVRLAQPMRTSNA